LLVLRKADFDRFMRDNRDIRFAIDRIAEARSAANAAQEPAAAL
jgi:CPA1 family monovalent cation:H+ antiporter